MAPFDHAAFRQEVERAAARIAPHVRKTPCLRLDRATLDAWGIGHDGEVWLKLEQLQASGSFKARGMFNRMLSAQVPAAGVIIASGGNAGIAAAYAARALGHRAEVYLPEVSSAIKRNTLGNLGALVTVSGATYADALAACERRQTDTGALMLHAYDQPEVVAGAGTLAREIEQQIGTPDAILVSVGGGGLIGGIAGWFARQSRVVALEPELAPTLHAALAAGEPVDVAVSGVAADSLGARRVGAIAWQVAQSAVAQALLLRDDDIRRAQRALWRDHRLAVEPGAALPLAALMTGAYTPEPGARVCLVVCGANVDLATLATE
ncbi:MAG: threonine/serine dehydratase [Betaproteobacteria bacterium]|nr:threonine/serine dehydratase [Betaproteobacteria bacterium]